MWWKTEQEFLCSNLAVYLSLIAMLLNLATIDFLCVLIANRCEGVICDRGLHLRHLMGILDAFYKRLGLEKIRFKPAYNPYTEPSMEIFG